jgi:phosphopantothenoylcysteine decarboxylase
LFVKTAVVRGWHIQHGPLLFAPAMNTLMWKHPITVQNISILHSFGYEEIACVEKTLACGDTGKSYHCLYFSPFYP